MSNEMKNTERPTSIHGHTDDGKFYCLYLGRQNPPSPLTKWEKRWQSFKNWIRQKPMV